MWCCLMTQNQVVLLLHKATYPVSLQLFENILAYTVILFRGIGAW